MTKLETRRMVAAAASACEDKKAEHIRILELDPAESGFTDFFLICSGTNERQNQTISTAVEEVLQRDFNTRPNSVEGHRQAEWILLDYVDFVVHIFSTEKRDFYDIERLRKTANALSLEDLKRALKERTATAPKKKPAIKTAAKKAVAKKTSARKATPKKAAAKKPVSKRPAKPRGKARKSARPSKL